jgi:trehalose 6-phosphate synthase
MPVLHRLVGPTPKNGQRSRNTPISSKRSDWRPGELTTRMVRQDWTPIRYVYRAYGHATGLYRAARVALVTPLRDGMNLVAKEYVASRNPDDPGVLILSRFAGAAQERKAALGQSL